MTSFVRESHDGLREIVCNILDMQVMQGTSTTKFVSILNGFISEKEKSAGKVDTRQVCGTGGTMPIVYCKYGN